MYFAYPILIQTLVLKQCSNQEFQYIKSIYIYGQLHIQFRYEPIIMLH